MMRLNDDGTASLDFDRPDGSSFTATIRRPTVGEFKRLRSDARRALKDAQAAFSDWKAQLGTDTDQAKLSAEEQQAKAVAAAELLERFDDMLAASTLAWWQLVLVGDDTFGGLATPKADLKDLSPDDWPAYLVHGAAVENTTGPTGNALVAKTGSAQLLLNHWQSAPLARGGPQTATI